MSPPVSSRYRLRWCCSPWPWRSASASIAGRLPAGFVIARAPAIAPQSRSHPGIVSGSAPAHQALRTHPHQVECRCVTAPEPRTPSFVEERLARLEAVVGLGAYAPPPVSPPPVSPPPVSPPPVSPPPVSPPPAVPPGVESFVEDGDPLLSFSGTWFRGTGSDTSSGSDRFSAAAGSSVRLSFSGSGVRLYGALAPHHGAAEVVVDDRPAVTVSQASPVRRDNVVFFDSGPLTPGEHTVVLRVLTPVISLDRVGIIGAPATTPPAQTPPAPSGSFITRRGTQLLRGGEPWWFVGYNSFVLTADCGHPGEKMTEAAVDRFLDLHMRKDGHGLLRVFFYAGWSVSRLDHLIRAARRNNVYLLLTLDDAIGGCGASDKNEAWFKDASNVEGYRAHMTRMLSRYRSEPVIAAWEWFNEPKWYNGAFLSFVNALGPLARELDPNHLLCSGTLPPYSLGGEANFAKLHSSPFIDIASMHEYDLNENPSNHFDNSYLNAAGKPLLVGEFSAKGPGRARLVRAKMETYIRDPRCCGALFWAWYGDNHNVDSYKTSHTETDMVEAIRSVSR